MKSDFNCFILNWLIIDIAESKDNSQQLKQEAKIILKFKARHLLEIPLIIICIRKKTKFRRTNCYKFLIIIGEINCLKFFLWFKYV